MAWTDDTHGTQTATISTEHTLATVTTNASYEGAVDLSNMAAGDIVELRVYRKVLTGGTALQCFKFSSGPQLPINPIVVFPTMAMPFGGKFTLKQTAGTGRNFDFEFSRV